MSCPNCGADARGRFCTRCGARVIHVEKKFSHASFLDMIDRSDAESTFDLGEMDVQGLMANVAYDGGARDLTHDSGVMIAESLADPNPGFEPASSAEQVDVEAEPHRSILPARVHTGSLEQLDPALLPESLAVSAQSEGQVLPSEALMHLSATPVLLSEQYPVQVTFELPSSSKRFWAVPILGFVVKGIMLVPHLLALATLTCVTLALQLVLWVPVLVRGSYPEWAYRLLRGHLGWTARVMAFVYGLTDRYPPFSLRGDEGGQTPYPVTVRVEPPVAPRRFWAIPILGFVVKSVVVLPHLVFLYALGAAVAVLQLVLWIPTLVTGAYPDWGFSIVAGYVRWSTRVSAYVFGLTDRYPPFQFNN